MKCHCCNVEKLSEEFPWKKLTDSCRHPPLHCMRCVVKSVEENHKCSQCEEPVENNNKQYQYCLDTLSRLFPEMKEPKFTVQEPQNISSGLSYISVAMLSGDSTNIRYSPNLKINEIKKRVQQELGPAPEKQRLLYQDTELKSWKNNKVSTLQDYGVPPSVTLHVIVLLYAIPETFDHVIFDLFWGYPSTGRDYLDASVLLYSGPNFVEVVDYRHTRSKTCQAVHHSGDVMDDTKQLGHHTINVHLKQIPFNITKMFFTLSAWNSPNISRYRNPSLRFFNASEPNKQLCSDSMSHATFSQAIIMCALCRYDGQWQVFSLKELSAGNAKNYASIQSTISNIIMNGIV